MKLTHKSSGEALLLALALFPATVFAGAASCGCYCGVVLSPPCSDSACKSACGYKEPSSGGGYSSPAYDYEAERRRQEAEAAEKERKRQEAEAAERERKRQEEERFLRERDAAAATLKGSVGGAPALRGLGSAGTDNHGLRGADSRIGRQLKSVEGHSRDATSLDKEPMSGEARKGFDTAGRDRGTIALPKISGTMPTLLDKQVPEGARSDSQVKQMLDWYRQLEGKKVAVNREIAALRKQQATSKDPLLSVKIETLNNNLKQYASDQATATQNAKKRAKDLGFGWNESGETKPQEGAKK